MLELHLQGGFTLAHRLMCMQITDCLPKAWKMYMGEEILPTSYLWSLVTFSVPGGGETIETPASTRRCWNHLECYCSLWSHLVFRVMPVSVQPGFLSQRSLFWHNYHHSGKSPTSSQWGPPVRSCGSLQHVPQHSSIHFSVLYVFSFTLRTSPLFPVQQLPGQELKVQYRCILNCLCLIFTFPLLTFSTTDLTLEFPGLLNSGINYSPDVYSF